MQYFTRWVFLSALLPNHVHGRLFGVFTICQKNWLGWSLNNGNGVFLKSANQLKDGAYDLQFGFGLLFPIMEDWNVTNEQNFRTSWYNLGRDDNLKRWSAVYSLNSRKITVHLLSSQNFWEKVKLSYYVRMKKGLNIGKWFRLCFIGTKLLNRNQCWLTCLKCPNRTLFQTFSVKTIDNRSFLFYCVRLVGLVEAFPVLFGKIFWENHFRLICLKKIVDYRSKI